MDPQSGLSLVDGWLPVAVQVLVLAVLLVAVGRRDAAFRRRRLPVCAAVGVVLAVASPLVFDGSGLASEQAPALLWGWVGLTGFAAALVAAGWGTARRWRRAVSVLAVPLCLLSAGVVVNQWVGYLTSVGEAVDQATAAPVADEVSADALPALRGAVAASDAGRVVPITTPGTASGFRHRTEYVYLPPAWFAGSAGSQPPQLPVLVMIGGEFNTPIDWLRIGGAQGTVDAYARAHGGVAPILVFPDAGGSFATDTECVDGPRGNSAAHIVSDVRPYVIDRFGASPDPRRWGVVGFSMGGTCALDLAVTHPELFDTFLDIAGDAGPEVGSKADTIAGLYGGDAAAWARFDPVTVLTGHARYPHTAGLFENGSAADADGPPDPTPPGTAARAGSGADGPPDPTPPGPGHAATGSLAHQALQLCALATTDGIACTTRTRPASHTWVYAGVALADGLPWVADRVLATTAAAAPAPPPSVSLPPAAHPTHPPHAGRAAALAAGRAAGRSVSPRPAAVRALPAPQ